MGNAPGERIWRGASARALSRGQERPGVVARAQPAVRAAAGRARGRSREPARPHDGAADQARDLDAARRSVRRPRVGGVSQGGCNPPRRLCDPEPEGAAAHRLAGSPASPAAPAGRNLYRMLVAQGRADLFLAYCTIAKLPVRDNPGQQVVALPDQLAVGADYGLTVMNGASSEAWRFAFFILSNDGQRILASHGFAAPGLLH